MKGKQKTEILTMIFVMMTALFVSFEAFGDGGATFSDAWYQDSAQNWHVKDETGVMLRDKWFCDDAVAVNGKNVWYLIDANGNMISAGLVQDGTGNYYSLETNHNGYYGMLRYQSGTYDGIYLDLESSHNGAFAAIKNQDGIQALKNKYGVTPVAINNSNIVYSGTYSSSAPAPTTEPETPPATEPAGSDLLVDTPATYERVKSMVSWYGWTYLNINYADTYNSVYTIGDCHFMGGYYDGFEFWYDFPTRTFGITWGSIDGGFNEKQLTSWSELEAVLSTLY